VKNWVINLDKRPERWGTVKEHLNAQGLFVPRFSGINNGWRGCRDSHLAIMEKATEGIPFAIFEDDVEFIEDISYVNLAMSQLPKNNWDALYLGASPQEPQKRYSDNLFTLINAFCMHAIIWNPRKDGAIDYMLSHRSIIDKIDVFMAWEVMTRFPCFVTYPMVCTQRWTGTSDTCYKSDTGTIIENYQRYCK